MKSTRILIITARFNDLVTKSLLEGALSALRSAENTEVKTLEVPGCFEIPVTALNAVKKSRFDAVVALGCVIRGETPHFDIVAKESASGLMQASLQTGIPMINGILTTDTIDQALNRVGLKHGNKGRDAALTALDMIQIQKSVESMK